MCVGFRSVDVVPSPKFQLHLVGDLVEASVNVTFNGALPNEGVAVKSDCGANAYTVTDMVMVLLVSVVAVLRVFIGAVLLHVVPLVVLSVMV